MKFLIPVVAVVVILESVILVSSLSKGKKVEIFNEGGLETKTTEAVNREAETFEMAVIGPGEVVRGKEFSVGVDVVSGKKRALDAVNLYVKYDASAFEIRNLVFSDKLPEPTFSKVSRQKSLIVVNYLISESGGFKIEENENLMLLKFDAVALKAGDFDFEISTGNESKESATMFVENATSEALPFVANKLNVKVLNK